MKKLLAAVLTAALLISAFTACTVIENNGENVPPADSRTTAAPPATEDPHKTEIEAAELLGKLCYIHEYKGFAITGARLDGDKVEKSNGLALATSGIRSDFLTGERISIFISGEFSADAFSDSSVTLVPHSAPESYNGVGGGSAFLKKLALGKLDAPGEEGFVGGVTVPAQAAPGIYDLLISCRGNIACCFVINVSAE
ncbi:MAG: hypothetical protein II191_04645 [Clostridia bacterium]|nr:hypothetical protein [Clostridia bacterium]